VRDASCDAVVGPKKRSVPQGPDGVAISVERKPPMFSHINNTRGVQLAASSRLRYFLTVL
jgi:hypothetical protein